MITEPITEHKYPALADFTDQVERCRHGYATEGDAICPFCNPKIVESVRIEEVGPKFN